MAEVELPHDYDLVNFRQLIDFVADNYSQLLTASEIAFQQQFNNLSTDAQMLYVRLLCRSKSVFRESKLQYAEIKDINTAAIELAGCGYVSVDACLPAEQLLALFTRAELLARLSPQVTKAAKRTEIEQNVLNRFQQPELQALLLVGETLLHVERERDFRVYRLCFFGNLYQDMTDFVLRDLGLTRFERYTIGADTLAFETREQIAAHLQYYDCSELLEDVLAGTVEDIHNLRQQLPCTERADANLQRRVARMVNTLARQLERLQAFADALEFYRNNARPPSRERQARIHLNQGEAEQALALCNSILQAPVNEEEYWFAEMFAAKAARALQQPWPRPLRYSPPQEKLELLQTAERVELIVADHYGAQGVCYYCENSLFNGVLGLAFWDIIFAPVKGVFFNPFQQGPVDLYEPEFLTNRAEMIDRRWRSLCGVDKLANRVKTNYQQKQGLQNPLVHWQYT